MKKIFLNSKSKGFGILETMLASAVLIMVVSAAIYLGNIAIRNSIISSQRVAAYNLAQEGMEIVRNIRDSNWLDGQSIRPWNDWDQTSNNDIDAELLNKELAILTDVETNRWKLCKIGPGCTKPILLEKYSREVFIYRVLNIENMRRVKVVVSWNERGKNYKVEVESYLTNWESL